MTDDILKKLLEKNVRSKSVKGVVSKGPAESKKYSLTHEQSVLSENSGAKENSQAVDSEQPKRHAIIPLRDIVVFPHMVVPLFVGRDKSINAIANLEKETPSIILVSQKDAEIEDLSPTDMYTTGVQANVLQILKLPDDTVKILVEGKSRVSLIDIQENDQFFDCEVSSIPDENTVSAQELKALHRTIFAQFERYVKMNKRIPTEILLSIGQMTDSSRMADTLIPYLNLKVFEKQAILEIYDVAKRLEKIFVVMEDEIGTLEVEKRIRTRVHESMEKNQRAYYLNEKIKAIQTELGDDEQSEMDKIAQSIAKSGMPKVVKDKAKSELKKLKSMPPMSSEGAVVRNYLDWLLCLPWRKPRTQTVSLPKAQEILDGDHYGLEKVKERIIEHLAVQARSKSVKGPILCLMGPPGVGKTSLAQSIADATGRKYVRVSLGGVRDESEIRGHRRTYVGSMPGKIINSIRKVKTKNPLLLLDEIDKLGSDGRGDPSSAMLEVLDPAQNGTFQDHYLEVDYDLSHVMFIATANGYTIPRPLLDRMEIIELSGYTEDEKVEIAKSHLVPRQFKEHNIKAGEINITDDTIRDLIRYYTREAGVRNLDRAIARLVRKVLKQILMESDTTKVTITSDNLKDYAGVRQYKFGVAEASDQVGVVTGLAWTEVGGDLLQVESVLVPGKGNVTHTGKLGDVMKESITAAEFYIKSHASQLGVKPSIFGKRDIHIHVPEGATPKDGPSAGIAMVTSMVSVLTNISVRKDIAMTGEVTLRGQVLMIGGLKEKLLAALRGEIKTVFIPQDNVKDLVEIPDTVKSGLEIIPVHHVSQVLEKALVAPLKPIEWDQEAFDLSLDMQKLGDDSRLTH